MENRMNAGAFRDIWGTSDVFKFLRLVQFGEL